MQPPIKLKRRRILSDLKCSAVQAAYFVPSGTAAEVDQLAERLGPTGFHKARDLSKIFHIETSTPYFPHFGQPEPYDYKFATLHTLDSLYHWIDKICRRPRYYRYDNYSTLWRMNSHPVGKQFVQDGERRSAEHLRKVYRIPTDVSMPDQMTLVEFDTWNSTDQRGPALYDRNEVCSLFYDIFGVPYHQRFGLPEPHSWKHWHTFSGAAVLDWIQNLRADDEVQRYERYLNFETGGGKKMQVKGPAGWLVEYAP